MKQWIQWMAVSVLVVFITASSGAAGEAKAKNIILMIGDGMGPNQMMVYNYYAERVLMKDTHFSKVMDAGSTAWMLHHSATGIVTDSAAAATAMSCGIKTLNGYIAMDPEGTAHPTFLEIAKRNGKKTAIVTNIPPYDATESAFTAHSRSRGDYDEIIQWTFTSTQPDILLGTDLGEQQAKVNQLAIDHGYTVITSADELAQLDIDRKTYGVLDVKTPYRELPAADARQSVTLSELTHASLKALSEAEEGFFIMIEGAKIDKLAHSNDAGSVLREMAEFDRSIGVAFDFARNHPDTLLIVTADHETGGMAILGGDTEDLAKLGQQTEALPDVHKRLGENAAVEDIQKAFSEATGIIFTPEDAQALKDNWKKPESTWGKILSRHTKVGFISTAHTATPVILMGYGPGSERCSGLRDNTEVFSILMEAAGFNR